jgi:RNA polymerase sigma-70 factor (ECF subfamily)
MDPDSAGHSQMVLPIAAPPETVALALPVGSRSLAFPDVYEEHFEFVFRSARRLGVDPSAVDDVVQETFLVAHRRLESFEGRSSPRTWLFGILRRVVKDHRRTIRRKNPDGAKDDRVDLETLRSREAGPHERAEEAEAVRILYTLLDTLDEDRREVFVLAELEEMRVPEIAEAIDVNVNTVYTRLRAARRLFEKAAGELRARDPWEAP